MKTTAMDILHKGRVISAMFYQPDESHCPLIIMSHGYNGHLSDFETSASYFAENGVAALCFTFCGGSTRDTSGLSSTDMTLFTEEEDLLKVLDTAVEMPGIDERHVFLLGGSQGGLVSALAASERPDVLEGLILLYPAFCIPDDWNERFAESSQIPDELDFWGMRLGRAFFETLREPSRFASLYAFDKPVLLMHGDCDEIVPLHYSQKAVMAYPNAQLEIFAGEKHGFTAQGQRRMEVMSLRFIRSCM